MSAIDRFFLAAALSLFAFGPALRLHAQSALLPSVKSDGTPAGIAELPPAPQGQTTIFGGSIRNFDPVRDQFMLNVVGQHPMRVLFDERTHVFRDGTKMQLRDLGPEDHASVETTLDGSSVFAVSIHILSQAPEGQYQGSVSSFNPSTGALSIRASSSRDPLKIFVSTNTKFARRGQSQFTSAQSGPADLAPGSLVSVTFQSQKPGHAIANTITVLAIPGSSFYFSGKLVSIDVHSGLLVLTNSTDEKNYQIVFNATLFPESHTLHPGDRLRVRAAYNGTNFVANELAAN
ncbi:MAG TPA: hypothetical protein VHX20_19270 [Terracidiphilus sp.]|jgi:hypothetical protein|nr:hypothetical protein [Terracidiphilus sp.]